MPTKKLRKTGSPGRPSQYGLEFQRDAVTMVLEHKRPIADVARSLGVQEGTLGNWVSKARVEQARESELSRDERDELDDSRRLIAELRMERDLLKRSLAFWVKESTR